MEAVLKDVYSRMLVYRQSSVDDILIDPALRTEFLGECRSRLGSDAPEEKLLRRLSNLRKQSKLPRAGEAGPGTRAGEN